MRCAFARLGPATGWMAGFFFSAAVAAQECAPLPCPASCLSQPDLVAELEAALALANQGDFRGAARVAESAFGQSGDPGAGFALVQLLEQAAATVSHRSTDRLVLQSQAADVARQLIVSGQLPDSLASQLPRVLCHEAIALAESGCAARARSVLEEAFGKGYCEFEDVLVQSALRQALGGDELDQLVSSAKERSTAELARSCQTELEQFQPFPFALNTVDVDANPLELSRLDQPTVVVCLWGSWCPACQQNLEAVRAAVGRQAGDVGVVVLAFENGDAETGTEAARQALDGNNPDFRVALGDPELTESLPGFRGFPVLLFLDRERQVQLMLSGQVAERKVAAVLKLLKDRTAKTAASGANHGN